MKLLLLFFLYCFISISTTFSQNISGEWNGILKVQGTQLPLVFHITQTGLDFEATMDSPAQGAKGIPVSSVSFKTPDLKLSIDNLMIQYEGKLEADGIIKGTFKQMGQSIPLDLSREKPSSAKPNRPQEPLKPYPYQSEDITFKNQDGIVLAGTLTYPSKEGTFPVVVLISGSGPQNRDEELMDHKPFLVLSDFLTRNGIAVLRYDDRGTGESGGVFASATTADFAKDAESAVAFLMTRKEINKGKIGLIGHSEGGLIAPMVANRSKNVAFIVLLAGPGLSGDRILLLQQQLIGKVSGMSDEALQTTESINKQVFEIVKQNTDEHQLKEALTKYLTKVLKENPENGKPSGMSEDDFVRLQVNQVANPWMRYFLTYHPETALKKVKIPVLALNGSKDLQVPAKENLFAIEKALKDGGNNNSTIIELPGLNHLFQEAETGSPAEYANIEQTFAPVALQEILKWIQTQIK